MRLSEWSPTEWEEMRGKLDQFSLEELQRLATRVGLQFTEGNASLTDREQFINAVDEGPKEELIREYERILSERTA